MELLFIYNAEKDLIGGLVDYAHKLFMPSTYKCNLCALTHHNFGQRKSWKSFVGNTDLDFTFYYINEFEKKFNESHHYPVVLMRENGENRVVLNHLELGELLTIEDFIVKIEKIIIKVE